MERILRNPDWIFMSSLKWDSVVDKIVAQANIEEKLSKAVQNKLKEMSVIYVEDNHTITITQLDYTVAMVHNFVQVYCREIFFWV